MTLAVDENAGRADQAIDAFLESYYSRPAAELRQRQACFGGPKAATADYLRRWAEAGASHLIVRFTGDHERNLDTLTELRAEVAW